MPGIMGHCSQSEIVIGLPHCTTLEGTIHSVNYKQGMPWSATSNSKWMRPPELCCQVALLIASSQLAFSSLLQILTNKVIVWVFRNLSFFSDYPCNVIFFFNWIKDQCCIPFSQNTLPLQSLHCGEGKGGELQYPPEIQFPNMSISKNGFFTTYFPFFFPITWYCHFIVFGFRKDYTTLYHKPVLHLPDALNTSHSPSHGSSSSSSWPISLSQRLALSSQFLPTLTIQYLPLWRWRLWNQANLYFKSKLCYHLCMTSLNRPWTPWDLFSHS